MSLEVFLDCSLATAVSGYEVSSRGFSLTFRGIYGSRRPNLNPSFFSDPAETSSLRLYPLQHIPDSEVYVCSRVCLTRCVPLSGFLWALLTVCSFRTL